MILKSVIIILLSTIIFLIYSMNELNGLNIEGMLLDNVVDQSQRPFTSMLPSSRLVN